MTSVMAHTHAETRPRFVPETRPPTPRSLAVDLDAVVHHLQITRRTKIIGALIGVVALLAVSLAVTYASYRDIPAPAHPANNSLSMPEPNVGNY